MSKYKDGDRVVILPGIVRYNHWTFDQFKKQKYLTVVDANHISAEVQVACEDYPDTALWLKDSEIKIWEPPAKPRPEIIYNS